MKEDGWIYPMDKKKGGRKFRWISSREGQQNFDTYFKTDILLILYMIVMKIYRIYVYIYLDELSAVSPLQCTGTCATVLFKTCTVYSTIAT